MMIKEKSNRLYWIDAARGIGALGVAIMHMFEHMRRLYPNTLSLKENGILGLFITDFFNLGKIGVVVFFFISGYVIPFSLKGKTLGQFAFNRFFRLYPAYWISLILAIWIFGVSSTPQILANITMFQRFVGIQDIVGVYWTLQIEIVFYFICGVLFYFSKLFETKALTTGLYLFLLITVALSIVRYITEIKLPIALPLSLCVMFLGMLLRADTGVSVSKKMFSPFFLFLVCLLATCFFAYNKDYGFNERWDKYFVSYVAGLLLFLSFKWWNGYNKFLVFFGEISYSLYLLHPVMGLGLADMVKRLLFPNMGPIVYVFVFLLFSILSAALCYYLVEKPAVKLGRNLLKRKSASFVGKLYK